MRPFESIDRNGRAEYERELDRALAGSFPASDPPPWTLGVAAGPSPAGAAAGSPALVAEDVIVDDGVGRGSSTCSKSSG